MWDSKNAPIFNFRRLLPNSTLLLPYILTALLFAIYMDWLAETRLWHIFSCQSIGLHNTPIFLWQLAASAAPLFLSLLIQLAAKNMAHSRPGTAGHGAHLCIAQQIHLHGYSFGYSYGYSCGYSFEWYSAKNVQPTNWVKQCTRPAMPMRIIWFSGHCKCSSTVLRSSIRPYIHSSVCSSIYPSIRQFVSRKRLRLNYLPSDIGAGQANAYNDEWRLRRCLCY